MDQYFFKVAFATAGDVASIPRDLQPGGEMSYEEGFTSDYSLPNSDPSAKKVPRGQSNQLYLAITENLNQYQTYGTPEWITAADNDAVAYSYEAGARVKYGGAVWVSLVGSNTAEPSTDATKWQLAATIQQTVGGYSGVVSVTSTPYTILAGNIGKLHVFSGSAANATLPAIAGINVGEAFPMLNVLSSDVVIARDGSSTIAGVSASTTAFTLPPYGWATPLKSDTSVWTVPALLANNSVSRKAKPAAQALTDVTDVNYTFAHSFGVVPDMVSVKLVCTSADLNYDVGDVVVIAPGVDATGNYGIGVRISNTNVVVMCANGGISIVNKTTRAFGLIAANKWDMSVVAYA